MNESIGAVFLRHYDKFLGELADREIFKGHSHDPTIQILSYRNVFPDCNVLASFGLSHFYRELGGLFEVVLPVDVATSAVSTSLANALFYAVDRSITLGRGVSIAGIGQISPQLADTFGKEAIYLTTPFGFPDDFATVRQDGTVARVLAGMFISKGEHDYFMDHGCEEFERLLEREHVDPFHIARRSVCD